jgi:putative salt-induced outer membrane protein
VLLGATVRTGNTDNAGTTAEVTVAYADGPWLHKGEAGLDYLRNRTQTLEQAFEGQYEAQYQLDARNFSYGLAHYEDDRFSGFDYEFTSSLGLGRHLINDPGHAWTVTLGPSLRLAQPSNSDSQDRALGARFTNLLSWELSDTAKLDNETEALADQERARVNNDVVLKVRIIDQLSGQISFGFEYRSDTPDGAEHIDTTSRAAVVYDF